MGCNSSKERKIQTNNNKTSPEIVISFIDDAELEKQKKEKKSGKNGKDAQGFKIVKGSKHRKNRDGAKNASSSDGKKDVEATNDEKVENATNDKDTAERDLVIKQSEESQDDVQKIVNLPGTTERRHTTTLADSSPCIDLSAVKISEEKDSLPSDYYTTVYTENEYNRRKSEGWNPYPSAGITADASKRNENLSVNPPKLNETNDKAGLALFRFVCAATNNSAFYNYTISDFHIHRASSLTSTFQDTLFDLIFNADIVHHLELSGNNAGPVAIKALLLSLSKSDLVENLDISNNMADSECSEAIMKILKTSQCLRQLNLSGNQLGKESLSKRLGEGFQNNNVLTKLNISNCGAINFDSLFDGIRKSFSFINPPLQYLNISNNEVTDGHQLGKDIATVLEHPRCNLSFLNIENTGLNPLGWDAIIAGLKINKSLQEFIAGGSSNQARNLLKIGDIITSNKLVSVINLSGISVLEKLDPDGLETKSVEVSSNLGLEELNLSSCDLTDCFLESFAQAYPGKLSNLIKLNLSNNYNVTTNGIVQFCKLLANTDKKQLKCLFLSGLNLNEMVPTLVKYFVDLKTLSLSKSRISLSELSKLPEIAPSLTNLTMDGIKLGKSEVLSCLLGSASPYHLTSLSLRGCSLMDTDLTPLVNAFRLKGAVLDSLKELDISFNRIVDGLKELTIAFTIVHPHLECLNLSQNEVNDDGACAFAKFFLSKDCKSCLKTLNISQNNLGKRGLLALVSTVGSRPEICGITFLDVSNQKSKLNEDDLEDVVEALTAALGLDPELALQSAQQSMPPLSHTLSVNLTNLGGTAGQRARQLDSVAVKTDFVKLCNTLPSVSDYLLISAGLKKKSFDSSDSHVFTLNEWKYIIGSDAPSWLMVESERRNSVYINHLPGSATSQRLQSILEMEADCSVAEIVFVKDPVFFKQSGAAWVLFNDETSVQQAIDFYTRGEAQVFGSPFTISAVSVSVSDTNQDMKVQSERDKKERVAQRQLREKSDQAMMEASQQLAEERAAYREAHPAYQNGRIW